MSVVLTVTCGYCEAEIVRKDLHLVYISPGENDVHNWPGKVYPHRWVNDSLPMPSVPIEERLGWEYAFCDSRCRDFWQADYFQTQADGLRGKHKQGPA